MTSFKGIKIETFKPPPIMEVKRPVFEFRTLDSSHLGPNLSGHLAESKVRLDEMKVTPDLSKNAGVRFMNLAIPETTSRTAVSRKEGLAAVALAGLVGWVMKDPEVVTGMVDYVKSFGSLFAMAALPVLGMVASGRPQDELKLIADEMTMLVMGDQMGSLLKTPNPQERQRYWEAFAKENPEYSDKIMTFYQAMRDVEETKNSYSHLFINALEIFFLHVRDQFSRSMLTDLLLQRLIYKPGYVDASRNFSDEAKALLKAVGLSADDLKPVDLSPQEILFRYLNGTMALRMTQYVTVFGPQVLTNVTVAKGATIGHMVFDRETTVFTLTLIDERYFARFNEDGKLIEVGKK